MTPELMAELSHLFVIESISLRCDGKFEDADHLILEADDVERRLLEECVRMESEAT